MLVLVHLVAPHSGARGQTLSWKLVKFFLVNDVEKEELTSRSNDGGIDGGYQT